jgi:hypothetical protein
MLDFKAASEFEQNASAAIKKANEGKKKTSLFIA